MDTYRHYRDCREKQTERSRRISSLPQIYHEPVTTVDLKTLRAPLSTLVSSVHDRIISPLDILRTYGKTAVLAHNRTNCLTEVMISTAESSLLANDPDINLSGPLAGIPLSMKDTVINKGYDTTVAYSRQTFNPSQVDGLMIKFYKSLGCVPFVKTNVPISLLSFESANDLWGRSKNPHNSKYSPGGSTGGEAALLALGGSRIGLGTDVAGSVRAPAHYSGIYALRCSTGRWMRQGGATSMPGQEGVMAVYSPMARTMADLTYFTSTVIGSKAWEWDHTIHPIEWRQSEFERIRDSTRLRVGVMRSDGVVDPSPACARALDEVATALNIAGHAVFDVSPPSSLEGLQIASILLNSDAGRTFMSYKRLGEWMDRGAAQIRFYFALPRFVKYLHYLWVKHVRKDDVWASLVVPWTEKSAYEQWALVAKREAYRAKWHNWWNSQETSEGPLDFILTPPNATPACPHDGMGDAVSNCGYTFLWNLLDYTAGVLPVTKVDPVLDQLPRGFEISKLNGVAKGAYMHYDAQECEGLPVGVQVVGRRLTEETTLAGMEVCEEALEKFGKGRYEILEFPEGADAANSTPKSLRQI